jgi:L-amino acid N-acyltransferase YncA
VSAAVELRRPTGADVQALTAFFARLPEGERSFSKVESLDAATIAGWLAPGAPGLRTLALADGEVLAHLAVLPLLGWSDHVGEVRLVVDPARRRQGVGRLLARRAVLDAVELRLRKLVVEVVAEQEGTVCMFEHLGFRAEGLLRDHVRDHDGRLHDLVVLGHVVDDEWAGMATAGIADALA